MVRGKQTLTRRLLAENSNMAMSVSATTRAPRPGEQDGVDYYFVTKTRFSELEEQGEFPGTRQSF